MFLILLMSGANVKNAMLLQSTTMHLELYSNDRIQMIFHQNHIFLRFASINTGSQNLPLFNFKALYLEYFTFFGGLTN